MLMPHWLAKGRGASHRARDSRLLRTNTLTSEFGTGALKVQRQATTPTTGSWAKAQSGILPGYRRIRGDEAGIRPIRRLTLPCRNAAKGSWRISRLRASLKKSRAAPGIPWATCYRCHTTHRRAAYVSRQWFVAAKTRPGRARRRCRT